MHVEAGEFMWITEASQSSSDPILICFLGKTFRFPVNMEGGEGRLYRERRAWNYKEGGGARERGAKGEDRRREIHGDRTSARELQCMMTNTKEA